MGTHSTVTNRSAIAGAVAVLSNLLLRVKEIDSPVRKSYCCVEFQRMWVGCCCGQIWFDKTSGLLDVGD